MLPGVLTLFGVISFGIGAYVLAIAKSAFHEILAGSAFICFAVFFSSAAIVQGIENLIKITERKRDRDTKS